MAEPVVTEGPMSMKLTADGSGIDRRAFGHFVGAYGELVDYALGWVDGADHGRISVGLGAGNPGGGTFHATVFDHHGDYALALTDEVFETVPEGGPHLTAAEGRAHECIEFVWWVTDTVFHRDRRAWWLKHWLLETTCIYSEPVLDNREPALFVCHDVEDGRWQLTGASGPVDGRVAHLSHAIDADQTLLDILDLPPGLRADRAAPNTPWVRSSYDLRN